MGYTPDHKRMKPDINADPVVKFHKDRIGQMNCVITGNPVKALHHIMHVAGKDTRRDDRYIVPLAHSLHNGRSDSVHLLGSEAAFLDTHGFDLVHWAVTEWEISQRLYRETMA